MHSTTRKKNKLVAPRETGYYWVHWANLDGEKYERLGFYDDKLFSWFFPGETRAYSDRDLLSIDERKIPRCSSLQAQLRFIVWVGWVFCIWSVLWVAFDFYKLITFTIEWLSLR